MHQTRIIFMGTPDYAVPALESLAIDSRVDLALVVTQPDRPQGRGRKLHSPPVKLAADRLQLPTLQLDSLKSIETREQLATIQPDLIVVAAFGIILGPKTLAIPRLGCVNLHASLLPKYRGANPIAAAISQGEQETGVTLMQMDRGLDTGPMLARRSIRISPSDTTESLTTSLAEVGADLLRDSLDCLLKGSLTPNAQGTGATLTRPMTKNDGWIDWSRPAIELERHVRAMTPWPRAWTTFADGSRVQVLSATVDDSRSDIPSGKLVVDRDGARVGTNRGSIILGMVQLPGGKPIEGRALIDRLRPFNDTRLGVGTRPDSLTPLVVPVLPG
jgi:methionyl-tRNA formyltransferase